MATITIPLTTITKHVQTKFGAIILGSDDDAPEIRGYVRTWLGAPLPTTVELDRRLDRHGVVWGADGSEDVEDDGSIWYPLYAREPRSPGISREEIIAAARQSMLDDPPPPASEATRQFVHALVQA
ncbi:hypothetical protein ACWFNS_04720 [Oerskovia enterophila]